MQTGWPQSPLTFSQCGQQAESEVRSGMMMSLGSEPLLLPPPTPPPQPRLGEVREERDRGGWCDSECLACRRRQHTTQITAVTSRRNAEPPAAPAITAMLEAGRGPFSPPEPLGGILGWVLFPVPGNREKNLISSTDINRLYYFDLDIINRFTWWQKNHENYF